MTYRTILVGCPTWLTLAEHRRRILSVMENMEIAGGLTETFGYTPQWGQEPGHTITLYDGSAMDAYDLAWTLRKEFDQDEVWLVTHEDVAVKQIGRWA